MKKSCTITLILTGLLLLIIFTHYNLNVDLSSPIDMETKAEEKLKLVDKYQAHSNNILNPRLLKPYQSVKEKTNKPIIIAILGTDEYGRERSRSDVIMLTRYDPSLQNILIISVPRDSRVVIPGKGIAKVNAAHAYGGVDLQLVTLENLFNIQIDYFVHINFNGFISIVDKIGGVKISSEKDFSNKTGVYAQKGENLLYGETLLDYVRFRSDAEGDFGRIKRQQEVLRALGQKFINPGNLLKVPEIVDILKANVSTNMNRMQMISIIWDIYDINRVGIEVYTLKTSSKKINNIWYEIINQENLHNLSNALRCQ